MKKVVVLMSTYNGEKYIEEQIESILAQEGVEVELRVRDDGSTDSTLSILEQYASKGMLTYEKGHNIGVGNSFMQLLYDAGEADYYAFADQDDVWMSNKMLEAVNILEEKDEPWLYASDTLLVDGELHEIGLRFEGKKVRYDMIKTIFNTPFCGCTMVIKGGLKELLCKESYRPSLDVFTHRCHDTWILLASNIVGKVYYDERSFIQYRQHENNTIGAKKNMSFGEKVKLIGKHFQTKKYKKSRSKIAGELYEHFRDVLNPQDRKYLELLIGTRTLGGKFRFLKCKELREVSGNGFGVLVVKTLLGWI